MAKRNLTDITLPHGHTLKVDKLTDRTVRTVKPGDYLPTSLKVRGQVCTFYAMATHVEGNTIHSVFGSTDHYHSITLAKGAKVDVYRPIQ